MRGLFNITLQTKIVDWAVPNMEPAELYAQGFTRRRPIGVRKALRAGDPPSLDQTASMGSTRRELSTQRLRT